LGFNEANYHIKALHLSHAIRALLEKSHWVSPTRHLSILSSTT
jgi:hypothetical protein